MGSPTSIINICSNVRLNSKYEHSIYFPNASAQLEYFAGKVVKTFSAYSYLRRFWNLKVESTMAAAKSWNYLYFKNSESEGVQFYFINRINYINDATVELELEQDVIQTNLFRFNLLPCFVERQHVTDDTVGKNTVDEGLTVGEYVDKNRYDMDKLTILSVLIFSTINLQKNSLPNLYGGRSFNGIYSGMKVYTCPNTGDVESLLEYVEAEGKLDGIINMWMYPTALITSGGTNENDTADVSEVTGDTSITSTVIMRPDDVDGYIPNNNKLLTYPYTVLYATNNNGQSAVYRYELFDEVSSGGVYFDMKGSLLPDGGVKLIPRGYKGSNKNYDESLTLSSFPTCAWSSDEYKIWLAQTQNTREHTQKNALVTSTAGTVAGVASLIGGIATLNPAMIVGGVGAVGGSLYNGYSQINALMAESADKSIQPPQAQGSTSASINVANNMGTFSIHRRNIRAEVAKQIDDYFTMYGYKINRVQTPNIHAREGFTYVKTVGCHVYGNLNNEDTAVIENVFNNGVTFWVHGDEIGNYKLSNNTL